MNRKMSLILVACDGTQCHYYTQLVQAHATANYNSYCYSVSITYICWGCTNGTLLYHEYFEYLSTAGIVLAFGWWCRPGTEVLVCLTPPQWCILVMMIHVEHDSIFGINAFTVLLSISVDGEYLTPALFPFCVILKTMGMCRFPRHGDLPQRWPAHPNHFFSLG